MEFVRKCGDSVINTKRSEVTEFSPVSFILKINKDVDCSSIVGDASDNKSLDRRNSSIKTTFKIWKQGLSNLE